MATLLQYKCPCCGGAIEFDSELQKMKCPYCDTEFDVETLKAYDEDLNDSAEDNLNWESSAGGAWTEDEATGMRIYVCESCGGQVVGDEHMAATKCPYCDNPVVVMGNLAGELKPDFVIPFKLDREAAKAGLRKHLSNKRLLPKEFKDENHIDDIRGVYVPFWLFDTDVDARLRWRGTRVRTWSDSNYIYTETRYYSILRAGNIAFDRIPVDGSSKMADDLMESIEPFDFSEAVDFQTAYLAGYLADKYDVSAEESVERANNRVRQSTQDAFAATVHGYSSLVPEHTSIQLRDGKSHYALYPVWLFNTTYKGEKYTFAMNGQTGKFVGNLPTSWPTYFKWLGGLTAAVGAAAFALSYLIWLL
jgi:DNA-directed RNA polymerase subunit RPC12/RpoP